MAIGNFLGKFGQNEAVLNLIDNADDVTNRRLVDVAVHLKDKSEVVNALSSAPQLLQQLITKVGEGIDSAKAFVDDLEILLNSEGMSLEILLRLLSDLNMSVADLKDWIAKLGVNRVIELNQKYGADAMKFYGADWFAAFKGIDADTTRHVIQGDGTGSGRVKGCHDTDNFEALYIYSTPPKVNIHSQRSVGAFTEYEYNLVTSQGGSPRFKTTRKNLANDWSIISNDLAKEIDAMIRNKNFPLTADGIAHTVQYEGVVWEFYFRNDHIATIYPTL